VNESGNDVPVLDGKIIVRAVNVGGNDGSEIAPVLFGVGSIHGIDQTLGISISLIAGVRRTVVQHGFVDRVGGLVGENTCGKHGDKLLDFVDSAAFHNVVVNENIFTEKFDLRIRNKGMRL
jgi:hypothetical protein